MEPRLLSRGNHAIIPSLGRPTTALQWSHGFLAVETGGGWRGWDFAPAASMEPRLLSRGNFDARALGAARDAASMEPRLLSRGNRHPCRSFFVPSKQLQWSH